MTAPVTPANKTSANNIRMEQVRLRARLFAMVVNSVTWVLCILSAFVPLLPVYWTASVLAGKETKVSVGLIVTISVAGVAAAIAAFTSGRKMSKQKEELIWLRERTDLLEQLLDECHASQQAKNP